MGKFVMAISAGITAFILALTAGAVYAYRNSASLAVVTQPPASPASTTVQIAAVAPTETPTGVPNVSPQDAAALAAKFLNRTDLYSVELADQSGAQAYKVTFTSGDIVYMSLTGQVISTQPAPTPVVITQTSGGSPRHGGGHGGSGGGSGGGGGGDDGGGD